MTHFSLEGSVVEAVHVLLNVFAHDFVVLVGQCLCLLDGVVNLLHVALELDDSLVDQLVSPETDAQGRHRHQREETQATPATTEAKHMS